MRVLDWIEWSKSGKNIKIKGIGTILSAGDSGRERGEGMY
tara:strand:- start:870 stop:989 length:120 start_codon:yes stop_codon:yes gene_type:complete